jgi:hydroxymethylglutaryl-CoA reductase (NADPH)
MVTLAAQKVVEYLLDTHSDLTYVSVSANTCTDKKSSAINGILGRGKHVVAECTIPEKLVKRYLRTSPQAIADLNVKKNLIGTMSAGGVRTGNAHYANMMLAFYLACGQDGANVVEGSQGITHAETCNGDLYFSCTVPNVIVGTVGNGKDISFVRKNLKDLGCLEDRKPGENSRRLAAIAGATILCGELSLMGALCNPGELMDSHQRFERNP